MRYTVEKLCFDLNPDLQFGIIVGKDIKNSETTEEDEICLRAAEELLRSTYRPEDVREIPNVLLYREVMTRAGINPNKYPPSVEAMLKRILKGGQLPTINALVDLCNAISIENTISLGAHDLRDLVKDLEIRYSRKGDVFIPFGETDSETLDEGELVFTSGNAVQTRKWIWRQSELGKTTLESTNIFFQLVGFKSNTDSFTNAMSEIEKLITDRFGGGSESYIVNANKCSIEF